jgi:small redox-active disulfide protein 2
MLTIKILGPGCANCKKLEAIARDAVTHAAVEAQIEKVTDYADITKYNLLSTPGLVINEKVVSAGRIPSEAQIVSMLMTALEKN